VQYVRDDIERIAQDISQMEDKVFKEKYDVSSFSNEWNLKNVRNDVVGVVDKVKAVQPLHYRPYDVRFRFYSGKSKGFLTRPRSEIMQHLRNDWDPDSMSYVPVNVALVTSRLTKGEEFAHVCVVDKLVEVINLSPNTSNNGFVFPLFLRSGLESESEETVDLFGAESENLTPAFRSWLDEHYGVHYNPMEILGYIYAVLHANTYRRRYAEFLRMDFPRVPFCGRAGDV
jgi:predicted helicase